MRLLGRSWGPPFFFLRRILLLSDRLRFDSAERILDLYPVKADGAISQTQDRNYLFGDEIIDGAFVREVEPLGELGLVREAGILWPRG